MEPWGRTTQERKNDGGGGLVVDFEPRRPLKSFLYIVYIMVTNPRTFFRALSVNGGYIQPWLFTALSLAIPLLWFSFFQREPFLQMVYLMYPLEYLILAAAFHLAATRILGGSGQFQATFRVVAYTGFTIIFSPIPLLGLALKIYGLYLAAHGLAAVHRLNLRKGVMAVLMTVLAMFVLQNFLLRFLQTQMPALG